MKPGFHKGFDEADRGKDVRRDQRSGKQCSIECMPRARTGQGQSVLYSLYNGGVTALLSKAA